jgi:uncharacterized DUF497 family protein
MHGGNMEILNLKYSKFQWDIHNLKKLLKHRVSQNEVESCFGSDLLVIKDEKHSIYEDRYIGIGESINEKAFFIVFVIRDFKIRIISARKMHLKERIAYEKIKQKIK